MDFRIQLRSKRNFDFSLCFILFSVFYLSSGFGSVFSNNMTLLLFGGLGCVILFFSGMHITVYKNEAIVWMLVVLNIFITTIITGDSIKQLVLWMIYLFITMTIIVSFPIERILKAYVQLMYFLCICSLVLWTVYLIVPSLVTKLPVLTNHQGRSAYSIIVATIYQAGNVSIARNQSIFWEPGAFQTFVNLALIVCLFYKDVNLKQKKYIIVFILSIITTFSTGGYIVLLMVGISYTVYEISKGSASKAIKALCLFLCFLIGLVIIYSQMSDSLRYQLFGKVLVYFGEGAKADSSTGTRVNSAIVSFKSFLRSPLIGNGVEGMSNITNKFGSDIGTCTPINWFSFYGIIMGVIMNAGLVLFVNQLRGNRIVHLLMLIAVFLSIFSENYWRNPSLLIFVFMGYRGKYHRENFRN